MPNWYVYLMGVLLLIGLVAVFRIVSRILRSRSPGKERDSGVPAQGGDGSVNPLTPSPRRSPTSRVATLKSPNSWPP